MIAILVILAIVALAVFLWAVDAILWELVDGEPEEGAELYPVIAASAALFYILIGHFIVT